MLLLQRVLELEEPRDKRQKPFLVDLNCGTSAKNLCLLYKNEKSEYSALYGFNFKGKHSLNIPCPCTVFFGPVRFTQCRHIPWVVFSSVSYEEALDAVKQHGHPESRVHPLTRKLLVKPPRVIYVTKPAYNLRKRVRDKKR